MFTQHPLQSAGYCGRVQEIRHGGFNGLSEKEAWTLGRLEEFQELAYRLRNKPEEGLSDEEVAVRRKEARDEIERLRGKLHSCPG